MRENSRMHSKIWTKESIGDLYEQPFIDLLFKAYLIHQKHFDNQQIQGCTLASIKTGGCPEDCAYCPQSAHYKTDLEKTSLLNINELLEQAKQAKNSGATRFCMGAAWRTPSKRDFSQVLIMINAVKNIGLETCVTLGLISASQAKDLKDAGLDFYNHNLDTSPSYYPQIISTRTYQDRLDTLENVRCANIKVCTGGIIGLGESRQDRIDFLFQLVSLPKPPASIPINKLVSVKGTPLEDAPSIDNFEFIRTIAITRILMPTSSVRLSAGRDSMSEEMQALCFIAGASSIFLGEKLLTTANSAYDHDLQLFKKLGLQLQLSAHAA